MILVFPPPATTMTNFDFLVPAPNLNGSDPQARLDDMIEYADALRAALKALTALRPHGRDYPSVPSRGDLWVTHRNYWHVACQQLQDQLRAAEAAAIELDR